MRYVDIEAMLQWTVRRRPQVPLAEMPGRIARLPHQFSNRRQIRIQACRAHHRQCFFGGLGPLRQLCSKNHISGMVPGLRAAMSGGRLPRQKTGPRR